MVEILRNKNLATRFQILAEIANSGPNIQQRDIAKRLEVTPQAISDYIGQLLKEDLIILENHYGYRLTQQGVNWMIRILKELKDYNDFVVEAITNFSISAAIAESQLEKEQKVGLKMENGLLIATSKLETGARGIVVSDVKATEDVGIRDIEGIVGLTAGKVTILKVPNIQRGGSRMVDYQRLKDLLEERKIVGAIGIEALVALEKVKASFIRFFGVKEAVVESAQHGMFPLVACVEDEISSLIRRLEEENLVYELIDIEVEIQLKE